MKYNKERSFVMKLGVRLPQEVNLKEAGRLAKKCEDMGFDSIWLAEMSHDPFILIPVLGEHTNKIRLGTSVALALVRNPMSLAYTCWDLQRLTEGRFILGVGTQVKGHIERRFGIPWNRPLERLEEIISAIRTIWSCWQNGEKLNFKGNFYSFNLMTPFFNPGSIEHPHIPVHIAGVNPGLCRLAGRVADGIHIHPLHTPEYFREIIMKSVKEGLNESGDKKRDFEVFVTALTVLENGDIERKLEDMKEIIAFYSSTRTYRKVMELHGWDEAVNELHKMSLKGEWSKMKGIITDEMLEKFCIICEPEDFTKKARKRYGNHADIVSPYLFFKGEDYWERLR